MRKYQLTYQYENRAGIEADDQTAAPGPFVRVATLSREDQAADLSNVETRNRRDAIWELLDEAGAALDAIG